MGLMRKLYDFGLGAGKGVLTSAAQASDLITSTDPALGLTKLTGKIAQKVTGNNFTVDKSSQQILSELPSNVTKPSNPLQRAGFITERVAEIALPMLKGTKLVEFTKTPLTRIAEKLYKSALKPSTTNTPTEVQNLVRTGINERIWISEGGIEKMQGKLDTLEDQLTTIIDQKAKEGVKLSIKGLSEFTNRTKKMFANIADPEITDQAVKEIDDITARAIKRYAPDGEIPIDVAQKIKKATMLHLRKYYGKLSGASEEAQKGIASFLRKGIEDLTEGEAGQINKRIGSLLDLEKELNRAVNRLGNTNPIDLATNAGTVIGAATSGVPGAMLAGAAGTGLRLTKTGAGLSGASFIVDLIDKTALPLINKGQIPATIFLEHFKKSIVDAYKKANAEENQQ